MPGSNLADSRDNQTNNSWGKISQYCFYAAVLLLLLAAIRVLVCPRPLKTEELAFLKWGLGTIVAALSAPKAIARLKGKEPKNKA